MMLALGTVTDLELTALRSMMEKEKELQTEHRSEDQGISKCSWQKIKRVLERFIESLIRLNRVSEIRENGSLRSFLLPCI